MNPSLESLKTRTFEYNIKLVRISFSLQVNQGGWPVAFERTSL